uniref:Uncharacterized protein n=1 Tax=Aegilops tauschii subsp. strangulata TaxID=200361 RepID=A0A453N4K5_AEGTS
KWLVGWLIRSDRSEQEFRRTRGNLSSMREHADLLSSVRGDITESKVSCRLSPGYRRHVAEGAFAPGEGFHSRQRQPDRRGNWASSKHESSPIQSEGLVWRCSGKSQAVG